MANLIYQGKIIRQLQGKLICHFSKTLGLQYVIWGGSLVNISNNITFFHSVKRIE